MPPLILTHILTHYSHTLHSSLFTLHSAVSDTPCGRQVYLFREGHLGLSPPELWSSLPTRIPWSYEIRCVPTRIPSGTLSFFLISFFIYAFIHLAFSFMCAINLRMTRRSRLNWILLIQSFILSSPWLIKLGTRDFQFCIFCAKFQKAWNFSWVPDKTRNFSEFRKAHSNLIILLRSCPLESITE